MKAVCVVCVSSVSCVFPVCGSDESCLCHVCPVCGTDESCLCVCVWCVWCVCVCAPGVQEDRTLLEKPDLSLHSRTAIKLRLAEKEILERAASSGRAKRLHFQQQLD